MLKTLAEAQICKMQLEIPKVGVETPTMGQLQSTINRNFIRTAKT